MEGKPARRADGTLPWAGGPRGNIKEKASRTPASSSSGFLAVLAMWQAVSCPCHHAFLSQKKPFFLQWPLLVFSLSNENSNWYKAHPSHQKVTSAIREVTWDCSIRVPINHQQCLLDLRGWVRASVPPILPKTTVWLQLHRGTCGCTLLDSADT